METLIALLIVCAVVAVLIWLIQQIKFGPEILKSILTTIVIITAIVKVWPMMG